MGRSKVCYVPGCFSVRNANNLLSWHTFPRSIELRLKWLKTFGVDYSELKRSNYHSICSLHFAKDDIYNRCGEPFLKTGVLPLQSNSENPKSSAEEIPSGDCYDNRPTVLGDNQDLNVKRSKVRQENKSCAVTTCPNTSKANKSLSWHHFPPKTKQLLKWIQICGLRHNPLQYEFVCSVHFDVTDFSDSCLSILKSDVYPSLFLPVASSFRFPKKEKSGDHSYCLPKIVFKKKSETSVESVDEPINVITYFKSDFRRKPIHLRTTSNSDRDPFEKNHKTSNITNGCNTVKKLNNENMDYSNLPTTVEDSQTTMNLMDSQCKEKQVLSADHKFNSNNGVTSVTRSFPKDDFSKILRARRLRRLTMDNLQSTRRRKRQDKTIDLVDAKAGNVIKVLVNNQPSSKRPKVRQFLSRQGKKRYRKPKNGDRMTQFPLHVPTKFKFTVHKPAITENSDYVIDYLNIKTDCSLCCMCLEKKAVDDMEAIITGEQCNDFGRIFSIVSTMSGSEIMTPYCCSNCADNVLDTFNMLLKVNLRLIIANKRWPVFPRQSPIFCDLCETQFQSHLQLFDHVMLHAVEPLAENPHIKKPSLKGEETEELDAEEGELLPVGGRSATGQPVNVTHPPLTIDNEHSYTAAKSVPKKKKPLETKLSGSILCHICGELKKRKQKEKHFRSHFRKIAIGAKRCQLCKVVLNDWVEYDQHQMQVHNVHVDEIAKRKLKKCRLCHLMFGTHITRNAHERAVHVTETVYPCPVCSKTFHFYVALLGHCRKMHPGIVEKAPKNQTKRVRIRKKKTPNIGISEKSPKKKLKTPNKRSEIDHQDLIIDTSYDELENNRMGNKQELKNVHETFFGTYQNSQNLEVQHDRKKKTKRKLDEAFPVADVHDFQSYQCLEKEFMKSKRKQFSGTIFENDVQTFNTAQDLEAESAVFNIIGSYEEMVTSEM